MSISIELGSPLESFVDQLVEAGTYPSRDAVLRQAVRLMQDRSARLAEIEAGIDRGLADAEAERLETPEEVRAHLDATFANLPKHAAAG